MHYTIRIMHKITFFAYSFYVPQNSSRVMIRTNTCFYMFMFRLHNHKLYSQKAFCIFHDNSNCFSIHLVKMIGHHNTNFN